MKKIILVFCFICGCFLLGCKQNTETAHSSSIVNSLQTQIEGSSSITENSNEVTSQTSDAQQSANSVTPVSKEVQAVSVIYEELYQRFSLYWEVVVQASVFEYGSSFVDGEYQAYVPITNDEYKTISDLKAVIFDVFTEDYYNDKIADTFFESEEPLFIEKDGKLQRILVDGFKYLPETIKDVLFFSDEKITFFVEVEDDTSTKRLHEITIIKIDDIWYIDNINYFIL